MIDKKNITGIILAGGKSIRMGQDKGFITYRNKPFIQHIINALQPLVSEIIIVSNNSNYDVFNFKRVDDIIEDAGPLAGLYSGLYYSGTENNLVLSCDVPLINTTLLKRLIVDIADDIDVVKIQSESKSMPLIALYKKRCAHKCLELLKSGEKRLQIAVAQFKTKTIILDKSLEKYSANINTPDQLKKLNNEFEH